MYQGCAGVKVFWYVGTVSATNPVGASFAGVVSPELASAIRESVERNKPPRVGLLLPVQRTNPGIIHHEYAKRGKCTGGGQVNGKRVRAFVGEWA